MRTALIEFSAYSGWSVRLYTNGCLCHDHDVGVIYCNGFDVGFLECKLIANDFVLVGEISQPTFEQSFSCSHEVVAPGVDVSLSAIALPHSASAKAACSVRGAGGVA